MLFIIGYGKYWYKFGRCSYAYLRFSATERNLISMCFAYSSVLINA